MSNGNPFPQFDIHAETRPRAASLRGFGAPEWSSSLLAILCLGILAASLPLSAAQAPAASPTASDQKPAPKTTHPRRHAKPSAKQEIAPPVISEPVKPPEPELPKWPVNEKAEDAKVTWDSQGLIINAANSSLEQILNEVATETGAKVEGIGKDLRIFGTYGPGTPRDVISKLLEGSGYNVLMIGDQGQGAPRQIVLSERHAGDANGVKQSSTPAADEDVEPAEDQNQQPIVNPGFRQPFQPGNRPPMPGQPQPPTQTLPQQPQ